MEDTSREWVKIRGELKAIRDRYKDHPDSALNNISTVIDTLLLTTYQPEHLHSLYAILDRYFQDLLGGTN
jgi:hypothetical protein